jgi:hypothetical protein
MPKSKNLTRTEKQILNRLVQTDTTEFPYSSGDLVTDMNLSASCITGSIARLRDRGYIGMTKVGKMNAVSHVTEKGQRSKYLRRDGKVKIKLVKGSTRPAFQEPNGEAAPVESTITPGFEPLEPADELVYLRGRVAQLENLIAEIDTLVCPRPWENTLDAVEALIEYVKRKS